MFQIELEAVKARSKDFMNTLKKGFAISMEIAQRLPLLEGVLVLIYYNLPHWEMSEMGTVKEG